MGIGEHILGEKKLRSLAALTGLPLERAYIRNDDSEGVVRSDGVCRHYKIDLQTGEHREILSPGHWTSCLKYLNSNSAPETK